MKTCQHCEKPLEGKQRFWCSRECKVEAYHVSRAGYYLSCLPQEEWRKAIRDSCERRWPGKYDRLRVRFGEIGDPPLHPGRYQG